MKYFLPVLLLLTVGLCAEPRGTTQDVIPVGPTVSVTPATVIPNAPVTTANPQMKNRDPQWVTADSLKLNTFIPANGYLGLQFDPTTSTLTTETNMSALDTASLAALGKAPQWMRADLANTLSQLSSANQDRWAAIINDAQDPYIDEIAFCVAHTSTAFLSSVRYANPQLFVDNAHLIYADDAALQYVQVVDHGTSTTDPNYYSTTEYYTVDENGNTNLAEVPRDIYYWYLVQPKLTDEIPAYIDPDATENNGSHLSNITDPPTGRFWREMFWNTADTGYPLLSDSLRQATVLWRRDGQGGSAVHIVTNWINATMDFTSGSERPHQPVRIYRKHIGRCGEHADITEAAARTALIPCTGILANSHDHTWNEFWDGDWVHWEPVNNSINDPLVYENGWGWQFASVFEIRSDGYLTSVTPRYSEGIANIVIHLLDANGIPVDGARITLATVDSGSNLLDMIEVTDNSGTATFTVGEGREYLARAETDLGWVPAGGGMTEIVATSEAGQTYEYTFTTPGAMPTVPFTAVDAPADPVNDWRLSADFNVSSQILKNEVLMDDIANTNATPYCYYNTGTPGTLNLFASNPDDFFMSLMPADFSAYVAQANASSGSGVLNLPTNTPETMWLNAGMHYVNSQYVTGSIRLEHYGVANDDAIDPAPNGLTLRIGPNPMMDRGMLSYSLPQNAPVKVEIYNLRGEHVTTLVSETQVSGAHQVMWNGCNDNGRPVASGVYFCRVQSAGQTATAKVVRLR